MIVLFNFLDNSNLPYVRYKNVATEKSAGVALMTYIQSASYIKCIQSLCARS